MNYFLIPKKLDNIRLYQKNSNIIELNKLKPFLVENELITINEAKKYGIIEFLSKHSQNVNIPKYKTYFFSGIRKYNLDIKHYKQ